MLELNALSMLRHQCLVGGQWIASSRTFRIRNPADGSLVAEVPRLGQEEARRAIEATTDGRRR